MVGSTVYVQRKRVEAFKKIPLWEKAMDRWDEMYYCANCDGVYIPWERQFVPVAQMQALVAQGMADGAVGLSTGLEYLPCAYADTAELIALCRPAGAAGGIYVTHMRSYRPETVASAVAEQLAVVTAVGRVPQLVRILDRVRDDRPLVLLAVPRALVA